MKDHITVVGNIASVPERRRLNDAGDTVVNFRLAANQSYYDSRAGKWVDGETNFYTVSAYRTLGEHALGSLYRGERVIVTGVFRLRSWDNGEKKGTSAEIDADALGHDLRWGTTQFQRDQTLGHSSDEGQREQTGATAEAATAEWAAAPLGGATGEEGALVGAGAGVAHDASTQPDDDAAPF